MAKEFILAALVVLASYSAHAADFLDAEVERAAAEKAERQGDWDAAWLHYENIYDSTRTDAATRAELRAKFGELQLKVPPNTDESKAGRFKVRVYVFRALDVSWTDKGGKPHRAKHRFTDEQLEMIRKALREFAGYVWKYSWGNLKLDWEMKIIEGPLRDTGMVPGPNDTMHYFTDFKTGDVDCLFVMAKDRVWPWEKKPAEPTEDIPSRMLAGILPVLPNTKGALYIGFNMYHSSGVMIHEFMHGVSCALDAHQGYPQGFMGNPDNIINCFYLMRFATRKMWRELSLTERVDNPWVNQYCRDFLVAGPFSADGKPDHGLNEPFIEEAAVKPAAGEKAGDRAWKRASALGHLFDFLYLFETKGDQVAYAAATVHSARDRFVQLRMAVDNPCKVWQEGKLLLRLPGEGGAMPDQNIIHVRLKKGPNLFLIKTTKAPRRAWRLFFRISDAQGHPLPDVKYVLPDAQDPVPKK